MSNFEPVIGLEIHVQLKTRSKMFCSCPNQTENVEPNTHICQVCTGQPGSLPAANQEALEKALKTGLALTCEIPEFSKFDRKNYFYPDLPKGYQISQFDQPLCGRGLAVLPVEGGKRNIHITRAHLEEDAGKLIHPRGANYSLVDLNRAGVPLLEIVTEPDFRSPFEAKLFLQQLRTIVRYLGVSDADMEKGHLRCDANISLREAGSEVLPSYKVEVKNMNSFKAVEDALNFEIVRQTEELTEGRRPAKETRGWSEAKGATVSQRRKEESNDYRYFPEPDLPVLHFGPELVEKLKASLPEMPAVKQARFIGEYQLPEKVAWQLVEDKGLSDYFEAVVSELAEWFSVERMEGKHKLNDLVKESALWCVGYFTELLNGASIAAPAESKITPENFAELLKMIEKGEVSKTAAKQVFAEMFATGGDPSEILKDKGLVQISDSQELESVVSEVISENPKVVEDFKKGKKQALGFLVGKVMAKTGGKANPALVNRIIAGKI